ncbi:MAG: pyridoxamine 5'-phosphate oxidase family protein [Clostridiaceae bacterium]|nr:pyridoxamine 5'-phosphate oxidase family protein [Clostridiaceae bacterium]
MFREMRRSKQLLSKNDTVTVLERCMHGVLACIGDDDYPYAVPLNYVYFKNRIYFHSAKAGYKIDAIAKNPKVSFAIIDEDTIVSEKYTALFRSVIVFGHTRIAEGDERLSAFESLVEKYSGDQPKEARQMEIARCTQAYIIAIDIDHITGKQAIEYVKDRSFIHQDANCIE